MVNFYSKIKLDRCFATRGQPLEADVYLTPNVVHNRLDVSVHAQILGIWVNLPPTEPNAYVNLFLKKSKMIDK